MLKKKVYFAAPLFSSAEVGYNKSIVSAIRDLTKGELEIYLPQENLAINDKNAYANSKDILLGDIAHVKDCDVMVAILDGQTIDAGVAAEVGYAYAKGIPVLGLYTDSRQKGTENKSKIEALSEPGENQFSYINLFVSGAIKTNGSLYSKEEELIKDLVDWSQEPNSVSATYYVYYGKYSGEEEWGSIDLTDDSRESREMAMENWNVCPYLKQDTEDFLKGDIDILDDDRSGGDWDDPTGAELVIQKAKTKFKPKLGSFYR